MNDPAVCAPRCADIHPYGAAQRHAPRTIGIARGRCVGNRHPPDRAREGAQSHEPEPLTIGKTVTAFRAHRVHQVAARDAQIELGER
jgi:hypothetical protein